MPILKLNFIKANHLLVWHKKFDTGTIFQSILVWHKKIWTSTNYFGTCRRTRHTLGTEMFYPGGFWLETRLIIKSLTHPCKLINFDIFSWELSKKNFKCSSKLPILKTVLWKFHGFVGLIDAKGIDVSQSIWLWGCLT